MLDKTLPYYNMIMRGKAERVCSNPLPELPAGFSYARYTSGDEKFWAEIECSVGEFERPEMALSYFERRYSRYGILLSDLCCFVKFEGQPVATATAWFTDPERMWQPALHWVAACPEFQGRGIGKAVTVSALRRLGMYVRRGNIYLHTQTWSHKAVCMYLDLGFRLQKTDTYGGHKNNYGEAIETLKEKMPPEYYRRLISTAELR